MVCQETVRIRNLFPISFPTRSEGLLPRKTVKTCSTHLTCAFSTQGQHDHVLSIHKTYYFMGNWLFNKKLKCVRNNIVLAWEHKIASICKSVLLNVWGFESYVVIRKMLHCCFCCCLLWSMYSLASSQAYHLNRKKQTHQLHIIGLKIPTGRRQTSWLFTNMTEKLNQGLPRNNSSWVVRAGLKPETSRFQVWCPNHSTML